MKYIHSVEEIIKIIDALLKAKKRPILVALDGRSGSGKTFLAEQISSAFQASNILGDNFYSGGSFSHWFTKSAEEKVQGCIDWKRLRKEALEPLLAGKSASWCTCNWETLNGLSESKITSEPTSLIILDGAYSSQTELQDIIDLSILVQHEDQSRRGRLQKREGSSFMQEWHSVWDEAEDYYFNKIRPASSFDLIFE